MANANQVAPIIPDLNRAEVLDRGSRVEGLDFNAYGKFRCAFYFWDFFTGKKGGHYYTAEFMLLSVEPDLSELAVKYNKCQPLEGGGMQFIGSKDKAPKTLKPGDRVKLLFPVARAGTATDPGKPARDDDAIALFVAAVHGVKKGPQFDGVAALKKLNEVKKFEDSPKMFDLVRSPDESTKELKDPETQAILKTYKVCFAKDKFGIVDQTSAK